jgi:parallel beta-helix repeat protein
MIKSRVSFGYLLNVGYTNPSGRLIFNAKIDTIFSGNLDLLKITNAYQYSEVSGTPLISNSTRSFYPRNIEYFEGLNSKFELYENYVIKPVDISTNPRQVWMRLYKNDALVDEKILDPGQNYSYYSSGREIISGKIDSIFVGATTDMMQFRDFYQYSETNGAVLMYVQKQTLTTGTRISKNNAGMTLVGSNENKFHNLGILNNYYGIYLKNSSFNNISNNNIQNNSDPRFYANADAGGILLSSSSLNNTIRANNMTNNSNGVYIKYTYSYINGSYVDLQSINNLIYNNNFINNIRNGYSDYIVNRWDNGYFDGGNYWSDYSGIDVDYDGIGDTPYSSNGVWDRYPFMKKFGWQPANPLVSFDVSKIDISINSKRKINLTLDHVPFGLSGYNISIELSNGTVAEIISIDYPEWATLSSNSSLPGNSVWLKASDLSNLIQNGATNVTLATLTVRGDTGGTSRILISVASMDDDIGNEINPDTAMSIVEVNAVVPFPCGSCNAPYDPDGDGLFEDVNGNGRKDFNDVVLFFNYLEWIPDNELINYFDFNGNGRIDFNDIIKLFEEL